MTGAVFEARDDVLLTGEGEERFVTDLATGEMFELNSSAAFIFESARDGASVAEIASRLGERHPEVPQSELERDVQDAIAAFVAKGLLLTR